MLCSEERHNSCLTYGYINSRFQMLTSHRLSLSFYFILMIMSWWCFMSLCNELNGFLYHLLLYGLSNPHGEQHKSCKSTTDLQCEIILQFLLLLHKFPEMKMRSNWCPWQQSKILSCLLFVDVVLIMLFQITVICASMWTVTHFSSGLSTSLPTVKHKASKNNFFSLILYKLVHLLVPGLSVIAEGTR